MSHGLKCPRCSNDETLVKDSRPGRDSIRRRRHCVKCEFRFTTWELAQTKEMSMVAASLPEVTERLARAFDVISHALASMKSLQEVTQFLDGKDHL